MSCYHSISTVKRWGGIEEDYQWCKKNNKNVDGFGQSIELIIKDKLSSELTELTKYISKSFH